MWIQEPGDRLPCCDHGRKRDDHDDEETGEILCPAHLWGTVRSIGRRLMDGIEPELVDRANGALLDVPGITSGRLPWSPTASTPAPTASPPSRWSPAQAVDRLQLRWVGHRLQGTAIVAVDAATTVMAASIVHEAHHALKHAIPNLDDFLIAQQSHGAD